MSHLDRHRRRNEFNGAFRKPLKAADLRVSSVNAARYSVEIVELPSHPFFIARQFHPEFKSRPSHPHPLFAGLIGAANA